jgi:single-stranded DNA-binding protein
MKAINFFAGLGVVVSEPGVFLTESNRFKLTVRVAFPRPPRRPQKGDGNDSDYYTIVAFGNRYKALKDYLDVGTHVAIFGFVQSRDITVDGERRVASEIVAEEIVPVVLPDGLGDGGTGGD